MGREVVGSLQGALVAGAWAWGETEGGGSEAQAVAASEAALGDEGREVWALGTAAWVLAAWAWAAEGGAWA